MGVPLIFHKRTDNKPMVFHSRTISGATNYYGIFTDDPYFVYINDNLSTLDWDQNKFTVDFWMNMQDSAVIALSQLCPNANSRLMFECATTGMGIRLFVSGVSPFVFNSTNTIDCQNKWVHFAYVRNGTSNGDWYLFANGQNQSGQMTGYFYEGDIDFDTPGTLDIGAFIATYPLIGYNFYMDDLRIHIGEARWTSNFTPPTRGASYTPTANDKLVMRFDNDFDDDSGNHTPVNSGVTFGSESGDVSAPIIFHSKT